MIKVVLLDLDETLLEGRTIDAISKEFGFEEELLRIRESLKGGEMSPRAGTSEIASKLRGIDLDEVLKICSKMQFSPGAREMVDRLHDMNVRTYIVSDNYLPVTEYFRRELDVYMSIANYPVIKNGSFTGELVFASGNGCGRHSTCKKEILEKIAENENVDKSEILAVGNGDVDACMLEEAGIGIAFNGEEEARKKADFEIKDDLRGVIDVLYSRSNM